MVAEVFAVSQRHSSGGGSAIILVVLLVSLILAVWALIDAAIRPGDAFKAAGQNKTLWIILPIVGIVFAILGGVLGVVYLAVIRPKVVSAQKRTYPEPSYPLSQSSPVPPSTTAPGSIPPLPPPEPGQTPLPPSAPGPMPPLPRTRNRVKCRFPRKSQRISSSDRRRTHRSCGLGTVRGCPRCGGSEGWDDERHAARVRLVAGFGWQMVSARKSTCDPTTGPSVWIWAGSESAFLSRMRRACVGHGRLLPEVRNPIGCGCPAVSAIRSSPKGQDCCSLAGRVPRPLDMAVYLRS